MKLHRPLSPGIRAQLMLFLAFICLLLLGMYWFLATQLLEPLYNRRIEDQLAGQADEIVELIAEAEANGSVISQWDFGVLVVDNTFRTRLYESLAANTQLINFCVDISDSTLRSVITIENLYPCLLHNSTLTARSDSGFSWDKSTVIQMRRACRASGSWMQVLNTSGGSSQMVVGRMSRNGHYSVLVSTSMSHVGEAGQVLSDMLPMAAVLVFCFALAAAWLFSQWFTKPLRAMSAAARQMAHGNYAVRVDAWPGTSTRWPKRSSARPRCSGTCWPTSPTTCAPPSPSSRATPRRCGTSPATTSPTGTSSSTSLWTRPTG